MKKLQLQTPALVFVLSLFALSASPARAQTDEPQTITSFGQEVCDTMMTNPAGAINMVPLRYVMRVALATELGGEDALATFLEESGTGLDEAIDTALAEGGFYDEDAGKNFFGDTPVDNCIYDEPELEACEDLFAAIEATGLMGGVLASGYDTLVNAAIENGVSDCGTVRIVDDVEDIYMGLIMIDNLWYIITFWDNNAE